MTNYNRINNITGWIVFIIATTVYTITVERTASYWDCGEFIATSYKLMIPHPPGAPLFLLIGRLFSLLSFGDTTQVAYWVNMVSVLSSAFTILFLFWTITLLAKKLVKFENQPSLGQTIAIMGSGVIGALAFTFSDSFWFSAEEAEVYAMSSFFTAFVFWAILKWESKADEPDSDRWLILIAYMVGLSIGVHLLNLVALPALGFVYYFKKHKPTPTGIFLTFVLSAVAIGVVMVGVITGLPSFAAKFEIFFVNSLGLPFNSGIIFFTLLVIGLLVYGIIYSIKKQKVMMNTLVLAFTFILIGYASYGVILIRSNYNPPIDMNDPENVLSFVSYLKREQYGDRPLLKGPYFTAYDREGYPQYSKGEDVYRKTDKGYVVYDQKTKVEFHPKDETLFPRAYSNQSHHVEAYRRWMNLPDPKKPTMGDNLGFLFNYQIGHMYMRYFMWNFAGRESDVQDADWLSPKQWFDKDIPELIKENKARNNYFMLPLIAGILGMIFHLNRHKKDFIIVGLLFFFTGLAIILYLNQPPIEPRERDYTFVGSFYAFCIWVGLAVMFLDDLLKKIISSNVARPVIATAVLLVVPGIMMAEGWDDHDRSDRYLSVDSAKNLLNSCAPNAILFTGGDNDTYPLWYVQEVEGFRTDVRVCNLSLLNTDWYIQQMKRKAYESQPLPISLEDEHFLQGTNDVVYFLENPKYAGGINLPAYIKAIKEKSPVVHTRTGSGDVLPIYPSKTFILPVDKEKVASMNIVPEDLKPLILDKIQWNINSNYLDKKSLIILDMLVTNNWERPIYFSTTLSRSDYMNLKEYTQLEGLAFRLLPVKIPNASQGWVNTDIMYENMMNKFYYRELDNPNVYYDENALRFPANYRNQFQTLAAQLYNEGKKDKAKEVLNFCLNKIPDHTIPYDYNIPSFIPVLFKVGEDKKAMEIASLMGTRAKEMLEYYKKKKVNFGSLEYQINLSILDQISRALKEQGENEEAAKYEEWLMQYYSGS
ncbi:MAG TPA: DUF2723 domain-containing protein [Cytophagaceae bacterium]